MKVTEADSEASWSRSRERDRGDMATIANCHTV